MSSFQRRILGLIVQKVKNGHHRLKRPRGVTQGIKDDLISRAHGAYAMFVQL